MPLLRYNLNTKGKECFFTSFNHVGLKNSWLSNHLRLINNKNTPPIWCFNQVFLYSIVFYVNIWTGMASNNTISWSATYDHDDWPISAVNTDLHSRFIVFICSCQHASMIYVHISAEVQWWYTANIRFNVFVILVCSIYDENNIWHVKSWRFTLAIEVVSQTVLYLRRELGCFQLRLFRLIYARSTRSESPGIS